MHRQRTAAVAIAAVALAAAACSSGPASHPAAPAASAASAAPRVSAAAACRDFTAWWAGTHDGTHVTDGLVLHRAVSEAPSGQLYGDMSAVETVLKNGMAGSVNALALQVVNGDCAAVNPAS